MSQLTCLNITPEKLNSLQQDHIVQLHQTHFKLTKDEIINKLKERDRVRLYYDKSSKELVGTVGVQIIQLPDNIIILYLGNAVVKDGFQRCGILSDTILWETIRVTLTYWNYKKYEISLATTSKAYKYFEQLPDAWPKLNCSTPAPVQVALKETMTKLFKDKFYVNDGNFIVQSLQSDDLLFCDPKEKNDTSNFIKLDPNFLKGDQLACCAEWTWKNFFSTAKKLFIRRL